MNFSPNFVDNHQAIIEGVIRGSPTTLQLAALISLDYLCAQVVDLLPTSCMVILMLEMHR